ncbi:pimeloyl-ACP methyl ester carboxylesterase [Actinocorallia herbida]|uniref:Pimeloyl-ACP methyl ester carboxylesterase n=1 Tax=Actinocorallia herbida TaxID=58109 RepID=A0A3N1D1K8_9ACTN|nr:alpha/beta hydrolase [Actinocorallia herbida]ROO87423.1 pimeloyl-ACP methyl ester carboxylesterase [Actinocorallia herbida]
MADDPARFRAAYDAVLGLWGTPVETVEVESDHGTTRVAVCGPPDGEPLVLLHGGGATSAVWFANAAELGRTRRVYAVDRIGEPGRSTPGAGRPRTAADLLGWLDTVLTGLGLRRADLCGHSYGGWIALAYALRSPERVRSLVLLDPTQCLAGFRAGYLLRALPLLLRPTARRAEEFLAWETGGVPLEPAWVRLYGLAAEFPGTRIVPARRFTRRELRSLAVPALVLLAGRGRAHDARRVAAASTRLLPGARTRVLPSLTHHAIPYTDAPTLNHTILDFLTTRR